MGSTRAVLKALDEQTFERLNSPDLPGFPRRSRGMMGSFSDWNLGYRNSVVAYLNYRVRCLLQPWAL